LLPVLSIEAIEKASGKPLPAIVDPGGDPEQTLLKKLDLARFTAWVRGLPRDLAEVGLALLDGDSQATIARRLKLSEAAITKRVRRLCAIGIVDLADLRGSLILT
jgi:DNA-directed RNA polymerase specialized sigma24 family protein